MASRGRVHVEGERTGEGAVKAVVFISMYSVVDNGCSGLAVLCASFRA